MTITPKFKVCFFHQQNMCPEKLFVSASTLWSRRILHCTASKVSPSSGVRSELNSPICHLVVQVSAHSSQSLQRPMTPRDIRPIVHLTKTDSKWKQTWNGPITTLNWLNYQQIYLFVINRYLIGICYHDSLSSGLSKGLITWPMLT